MTLLPVFLLLFFFTFYADVDEKTSEGLRVKARPPETGPHSQRRRARPPCSARTRAPLAAWERHAHLRPGRRLSIQPGARRRLSAAGWGRPPRRLRGVMGQGHSGLLRDGCRRRAVRPQRGANEMTQGPGVEMGTVQPASSCILQASPPRLGKAGTS